MTPLLLALLVAASPTPGSKPFRLEPKVDVDRRLNALGKTLTPPQSELLRTYKLATPDARTFAKLRNRLLLGHFQQTLFPGEQLRFAEVIDDEDAEVDIPLKHRDFTLFLEDRQGHLRTVDPAALRQCEVSPPTACTDLMPFLRPRIAGSAGPFLVQELAELRFLWETRTDYPEIPRLWLSNLEAMGPGDQIQREKGHPSPVTELALKHVHDVWSLLGYAQTSEDGYGSMQCSFVRMQLSATALSFQEDRVAVLRYGP